MSVGMCHIAKKNKMKKRDDRRMMIDIGFSGKINPDKHDKKWKMEYEQSRKKMKMKKKMKM